MVCYVIKRRSDNLLLATGYGAQYTYNLRAAKVFRYRYDAEQFLQRRTDADEWNVIKVCR